MVHMQQEASLVGMTGSPLDLQPESLHQSGGFL